MIHQNFVFIPYVVMLHWSRIEYVLDQTLEQRSLLKVQPTKVLGDVQAIKRCVHPRAEEKRN